MMWVGTPAFFAVVLLKVMWIGGVTDNENKWLMTPPKAYVTAKIEPSWKKCQADGTKWETDGIALSLSGKDPIGMSNGKWECKIMATGGLET